MTKADGSEGLWVRPIYTYKKQPPNLLSEPYTSIFMCKVSFSVVPNLKTRVGWRSYRNDGLWQETSVPDLWTTLEQGAYPSEH